MGTMTREEWLAERKSGIGGSEAAAILGLSPWATAVNVWLDKTGRAAPQEENEAMRIGTALEQFVADRYCQETGRTVQKFNKMIHKGCLLGNFDRLVVPEGEKIASHMGEVRTDTVLECKTSSREWEDGVPLYYQTQVQHYMGLEPMLQHADVACLFLGRKHFKVFRVERDQETISFMQATLTDWWQKHIIEGVMPQPTNEIDCKLLWARSHIGKTVDATEEIAEKVVKYAEAKATEKKIKEEAAALQSDICVALGDAEVLLGLDGKPLVTWKSSKDSSKTDWEALARKLGATDEMVAEFTTTSAGSRRFILKAK